eukprot:4760436-Pleurochrysis_carterae.AAC.2
MGKGNIAAAAAAVDKRLDIESRQVQAHLLGVVLVTPLSASRGHAVCEAGSAKLRRKRRHQC